MAHIIAIGNSEAQRRQLRETLSSLAKKGWPLTAKYEAQALGTWQELFSTVIQPGLFAEREAVVVESAEEFEDFPDSLVSILEDENADTQIILAFGSDTKSLKFIADKITLIKPEAQVPPWKRKEWLIDLAKSEGFKISGDAAQLLADSIESQEELRSEISKLGLYAGKREIVIEDVEALSFDEGGRAMMKFLDGICDNKPHDVAHALKYLRSDLFLPILTAITNRLRPAMIMSCLPESFHNEALKAIDNDPVKKKYAVTKSRSALKHYGPERIKNFMMAAARLSFLEKTNRAEGWQGFEFIIWELMAKINTQEELL